MVAAVRDGAELPAESAHAARPRAGTGGPGNGARTSTPGRGEMGKRHRGNLQHLECGSTDHPLKWSEQKVNADVCQQHGQGQTAEESVS